MTTPAPRFHSATVTTPVWNSLLALRDGAATEPRSDGWTEDERAAIALYDPIARRNGHACTIAQVGQSLDGRIATESGDARDVSGPDGLAHLHRIRSLVDAVVIGVRTALHDKPRLTVRLVPGRSPARVVIDPEGRLPDDATVLANDGVRRIVVQTGDTPRPEGVEVIRLPAVGRWIDPNAILAALHERGLRHVLVEGGGVTIAQFLERGVLSRLHVAVAPLIIGAGPQGLRTRPIERLTQALRPKMQVYGLGSDVLFDCAL
jgi:riboflavin-specific deaminase-like protein